jgi:hypothetical protein
LLLRVVVVVVASITAEAVEPVVIVHLLHKI